MSGKRGKTNEINQPTVKEMLLERKKRQENEEPPSLHIKIPSQLSESTDTSVEVYKVSMFTRVWFRDHSNVDEVLDKYLVRRKIENPCKNAFVNTVIRSVMKARHSRFFPFNTFQFDSIENQLTAKLLLKYPKIETTDDLEEVNIFFNKERIKQCSISMAADNLFYNDIKKVIDNARADFGAERLRGSQNMATAIALRKHYERTKTAINIDLQETTLQEMYEISNFENFLREEAKYFDIDDADFDDMAEAALEKFKTDPAYRLSKTKFVVKPKYNLIGNHITPEQERIISKDIMKFYLKTNAFDVLRPLKKEYEMDVDPSFDHIKIKKEIRKKFFLLYVRRRYRNLPPFHDLYWKDSPSMKEDEEVMEEIVEEEPLNYDVPLVQQNSSLKVAYVQRKVYERNETYEETSDENSKGSTVIEVVTGLSNTTNQTKTSVAEVNAHVEIEPEEFVNQTKKMSLEDYTSISQSPSKEELDFIKFASAIREFVNSFKSHVIKELPEHAEDLISNEKTRRSFINFILFYLANDPAILFEIALTCPEDVKKKAIDKLDSLALPHLQEDNWEPMITSTQNVNIENIRVEVLPSFLQNDHLYSNNDIKLHNDDDDDDVIMENEKDCALIIATESTPRIKVEPFSPDLDAPHYAPLLPDSEVQIMSNHDFEAVINISSESDGESDIEKMLQQDEDDADKDQFQLRLNKESQNSSPDVAVVITEALKPIEEQEMSPNTAAILQNSYALRLNEFEVADKKEEELKRQQRKRKKIFKNRVCKKKSLQYIDTTSSEERLDDLTPGMDENHLMINVDNFSLPTPSSNVTYRRPFKFVSVENNQPASDKGASCFVVELKKVSFNRDHQVFEVLFNLPQFSCYDCILKNNEDIKVCLNLNKSEWQTLIDNLCAIGEYEYIHNQKRSSVEADAKSHYEISVRRQLDLYFSTLSKFKAFQLFSDGHSFSCKPMSSNSIQLPTSSAIDPSLLSLLSNERK